MCPITQSRTKQRSAHTYHMPYVRKTPRDTTYYDDGNAKLSRIDNVCTLSTTCSQCGKSFSRRTQRSTFNPNKAFFCSVACVNDSQRNGTIKQAKEQHFLRKYGTTNPLGCKEIIKKRDRTVLERYGTTNISKLEHVKQKRSASMKQICATTNCIERGRQTMIKRYGSHYLATDEARQRLREYSQKTYGVDHPMHSHVVRKKMRQTLKERYGVDNPMKIDEIKEKVKNTCLRLYGVDNVFKRPDVIERRINAMIRNANNLSSHAEDSFHESLCQIFPNVERHVIIFHRKNAFWIVDFRINDVFIQFDGIYWHGISGGTSRCSSSQKMQLKAQRRDRYQDSWFRKRGLNLLRVDEKTATHLTRNELKHMIVNCHGITSTYRTHPFA